MGHMAPRDQCPPHISPISSTTPSRFHFHSSKLLTFPKQSQLLRLFYALKAGLVSYSCYSTQGLTQGPVHNRFTLVWLN